MFSPQPLGGTGGAAEATWRLGYCSPPPLAWRMAALLAGELSHALRCSAVCPTTLLALQCAGLQPLPLLFGNALGAARVKRQQVSECVCGSALLSSLPLPGNGLHPAPSHTSGPSAKAGSVRLPTPGDQNAQKELHLCRFLRRPVELLSVTGRTCERFSDHLDDHKICSIRWSLSYPGLGT